MVDTDLRSPVAHNYDLFADEAHRIIDQLVNQSLAHVHDEEEKEIPIERDHFIELENDGKKEGYISIQWPSIDEFTDEKVGLNKLHEYIEKEWKTSAGGQDDCWLYAIDFLERKSLEFNDLYIYRVRYSIPTRRQPIPRFTVSIYFSIDVSKIKAKNTPVKVSFVFETMRLIYQPKTFRFRQNWLEDIILLKEKLSNGIDF